MLFGGPGRTFGLATPPSVTDRHIVGHEEPEEPLQVAQARAIGGE